MSVNNAAAGGPLSSVGGVSVADEGAVLPTDASTALAVDYSPLGLVGNDGVTPGGERAVEDILDWAGDVVLSPQTSHSVTFSFPLLDVFSADVHRLAFGDENVTETAATPTSGNLISVTETGSELQRKVIVFDLRHVDKRVRVVVPVAKVTTVEEGPWQKGAPQQFTITLSGYKDSSGVKVYRYYDDGEFAAA